MAALILSARQDAGRAGRVSTSGRRGTTGAVDYSPDEHRPLASYALLVGAFNAAGAATLAAAHRSGRLPERVPARDVALLGIATHKLVRLVAKDRVTSFLRAPFTRYQEPSGHGEVEEQAVGRNLRLAVGELLICPNCLAPWVAGTLTGGLLFAPRATRTVAAIAVMTAISDALQLAYVAGKEEV